MMIYGRVVDSPTLLYKGIEKIHNLLLINCEICQGCPRRPCGPGVVCLLNGFSPFLSLKIRHCCSAVEIVFNNDRNTADAQFTMVWITTLQWCTSNAQSVEAVLDFFFSPHGLRICGTGAFWWGWAAAVSPSSQPSHVITSVNSLSVPMLPFSFSLSVQ